MKGQFEGRMISTSRRQPLGRTSSRPVRISPHLARNHSSTAHWPKHSRARLDEYPASIGWQQKGHKSSPVPVYIACGLTCVFPFYCRFCNACTMYMLFCLLFNIQFMQILCRWEILSFISTMNAVLLTKQADS